MKQGAPVSDEISEAVPKYFRFKVEDPKVTKVTI